MGYRLVIMQLKYSDIDRMLYLKISLIRKTYEQFNKLCHMKYTVFSFHPG